MPNGHAVAAEADRRGEAANYGVSYSPSSRSFNRARSRNIPPGKSRRTL